MNTLDTDATKATILAGLVPLTGPLAPVVSAYVNEYISDIKRKAGYGGAWVKMTIRNGGTLHVWEVYGLQEKTTFSDPQADGLPVDATTWEFGGTNEATYNRLAAHAYCKKQGYTDVDSYSTRDLASAGTSRFKNSGQIQFCNFCKKAFASVRCAR